MESDRGLEHKICTICERNFNLQGSDLYCHSRVYHCRDCGVCVMDMDHHCGVFDRCIGQGNIYRFYGVLIGFMANMAYVMVSVMLTAQPR